MKILLTTVTIGKYGGPRMMYHYATALRAAGHEVVVGYRNCEKDVKAENSILPELDGSGVQLVYLPYLKTLNPAVIRGKLAKYISESGFDVVISTHVGAAPASMLAAKLAQARGVVFAQNLPRFTGNRLIAKCKDTVYRQTVNSWSDLVICVAPWIKDEFLKRYRAADDKVHVVNNGLDLTRQQATPVQCADAFRNELKLQADEKLFLNISRIHPQKGLEYLIDAVGLLAGDETVPRCRVAIAGGASTDAEERLLDQLRGRCEKLGITDRITFLGFRNDCSELLTVADGFVLSSRWEGLPLVILEAFEASCPVIMTKWGPTLPSFADGKDGIYAATQDAPALAAAMRRMLLLPKQEQKQMGARGNKYLHQHLDLDRGKREFVSLIEQSVAGS